MGDSEHCRFCGGIIGESERYDDVAAHQSCVEPPRVEERPSLGRRFVEELSRSFGPH